GDHRGVLSRHRGRCFAKRDRPWQPAPSTPLRAQNRATLRISSILASWIELNIGRSSSAKSPRVENLPGSDVTARPTRPMVRHEAAFSLCPPFLLLAKSWKPLGGVIVIRWPSEISIMPASRLRSLHHRRWVPVVRLLAAVAAPGIQCVVD